MRPRSVPAAVLSLLAAACADEAAPRWVSLARDVPVAFERGTADVVVGDGRLFRRERDADGLWLATELERGDWSWDADARGGAWAAPVAVQPAGTAASGVEASLEADGHAFRHAPLSRDPSVPWRFEPGSFATLPTRVLLRAPADEEPPARATLRVFGGEESAAGELVGRRFSGDALDLASGDRARLSVEAAPGSVLRFGTVLESAFLPPSAPSEPVTFRVLCDGEPLWEHVEVELGGEHARRWSVPLPRSGRLALAFEVDGAFAHTAFLAPRVAPGDAGTYRARPWSDPRPDLVVFLADTLRADVLGAYGGELGLTPFLDELSERSLVLRRAWSTGTYTLPAHASMFAGVFPHQVGIVGTENGLPAAMVTVAEHLRDHGYRTGAVTDSVVVTSALGLHQGFEWFDELHANLGSTLERARAFLDADDGRPIFLFVHTYRTHLPYRVSRATREAWGERLGISGDPDRLRARIQELVESPPDTPGRSEAITAALERIRAHYLGGVVDLDAGFRRFCADLAERGLDRTADLVFASDHGEAFGEHGCIYHRDKPWEVLARVPLLLTGPDVEPGVVEHAASLVDLAPTLSDLAGLPPRPEWLGRSLLALDEERPAFVFECRNHDASALAVVEGERKVIGFERGALRAQDAVLGAFDLAADPDETSDLAPSADWPRELLGGMRPVLDELLEPLTDPVGARLAAEHLDDLRAMGYGGDE